MSQRRLRLLAIAATLTWLTVGAGVVVVLFRTGAMK
jgi:hypothetical protein